MAAQAGIYTEYSPMPGSVLQRVTITVLLLFLCTAGCLYTGQPAPAVPGSIAPGTGTPDNFLLRNIVNTSAGSTNGSVAEDRTAAAIRNAMDSRNPFTRDAAVTLIMPLHGGTFRTSQICDLYDAVDSRWTYVDDPYGDDYVSPASRTIALGFKGDCDDFAVLIAAMIESVGGNARVIYAMNGTTGHAYPEVFIGTTPEEFERAAAYIRQRYHITDVGCHITRDSYGTRYWLNLDRWSRHPGGRFFADDGVRTAYYPDGRWERVES